jgi:transcription initiation factor TFIIIB Brf1 subunit/transcription initiation factor TFIIB
MSVSLFFPGLKSNTTETIVGLGADCASPICAANADDPFWEALKPQTDSGLREGHYCVECKTDDNIVVDEDEVSCIACGTHLGYLIDSSAEYRWFGSDDRGPDPSRVGNPLNPLLPESSLGTRILSRPGDNKAMRRIRQYHLWNIMPYRERTLWSVFEGLQVRAAGAGISMAIVEETKQLYAQVSPLCICRGQQKDALLAACLFESLKRHNTPRRPVEIAEIFQIDVKLITRGVKQFSGLLEEHLHAVAKAALPAVASNASAAAAAEEAAAAAGFKTEKKMETASTCFKHYLEPAVYKLETPRSLHGAILEFACKIGDTIDELGICPETTPSSLAASALALTCEKFKLEKSNSEVAKVCSISAATLQKCLKRIDSWRPVLFKD